MRKPSPSCVVAPARARERVVDRDGAVDARVPAPRSPRPPTSACARRARPEEGLAVGRSARAARAARRQKMVSYAGAAPPRRRREPPPARGAAGRSPANARPLGEPLGRSRRGRGGRRRLGQARALADVRDDHADASSGTSGRRLPRVGPSLRGGRPPSPRVVRLDQPAALEPRYRHCGVPSRRTYCSRWWRSRLSPSPAPRTRRPPPRRSARGRRSAASRPPGPRAAPTSDCRRDGAPPPRAPPPRAPRARPRARPTRARDGRADKSPRVARGRRPLLRSRATGSKLYLPAWPHNRPCPAASRPSPILMRYLAEQAPIFSVRYISSGMNC